MVPTVPGVVIDGEEYETEPYVPMEDADDPGGPRLPDVEIEEPEEIEEDDPPRQTGKIEGRSQ